MKLSAGVGIIVMALVAPVWASDDEARTQADQVFAFALAVSRSCEDPEFEIFARGYTLRLYEAAGLSAPETVSRINEVTAMMAPENPAEDKPTDDLACKVFTEGLRQGEAATIAKIRALAGN